MMVPLPRPLVAWAPELEGLGDLARDLLMSWLPSLEGSIARPGQSRGAKDGEPNGFDGISRRGPIDRLLVSEWALSELAPEEFIRRASSGEQSFLRVARRHPTSSEKLVLLFDGGPQQVGQPRLAHLALLLVAAARARREGRELRWSVLQTRWEPRVGLDVADLRVFARPGTEGAPSPSDIDAALSAHEATGEAVERWWIGGPALAAARPPGTDLDIEIREGSWHEPPRLHVTPSRGQSLSLDLPPPQDGLRILRDPSARRAAPRPPRSDPELTANVFPEVSGLHLFFRRKGHLERVKIPGNGQPPSPNRRLGPADDLIALGRKGPKSLVLRQFESRLRLEIYDRRGRLQLGRKIECEAPPVCPGSSVRPGRLLAFGNHGGLPRRLRFIDGAMQLFALETEADVYLARKVAEDVVHLGRATSGPWFARATKGGSLEVHGGVPYRKAPVQVAARAGQICPFILNRGAPEEWPSFCFVDPDGRLTTWKWGRETKYGEVGELKLLGAVEGSSRRRSQSKLEPRCVCLDVGLSALVFTGVEPGERTEIQLEEPVAHAELTVGAPPRIFVLFDSGRLRILDPWSERTEFEMSP